MVDKTFFYPMCCHVCKEWDVPLISCAQCKMIFYCNEEHQQQHWPQHKEICAAIKLVLGDKEYMNTEAILPDEWIAIRTEYLKKVSAILQRDLKFEETEMFHFPKACMTCHRQDMVIQCDHCPSVAFCNEHRDESERHRAKHCSILKESFEVSSYLALTENIDISYVDLSMRTVYDMRSFLNTYVPLDRNNVHLQKLHSNAVSNPLTVFYCILKLNLSKCETLNIHIIGECIVKIREELKLWTMLLIFLRTLTTLTVTFVQKNIVLFDTPKEVLHVSETKRLVANTRFMSYEEYMDTADFTKPDFIVGFSAIIRNDFNANYHAEISPSSGRALARQKCPCVLVYEYIYEVDRELLYILEKFSALNPFTSFMPHRYFTSERPYYPNNYLTFFDKLDCSEIMINKDNKCIFFP